MSLAQGWGSAADLQMQVQGLQMENARLKEELSTREDDIRTEQHWVAHWKEENARLAQELAASELAYEMKIGQLMQQLAAAQKDVDRLNFLERTKDFRLRVCNWTVDPKFSKADVFTEATQRIVTNTVREALDIVMTTQSTLP